MLAFSFLGLFEGPELPSPESTAPGTLFNLKELVNGVPRATLYIFSNEGKWLKIEDSVNRSASSRRRSGSVC